MTDEFHKRYYTKEEEFLDEWYNQASLAAQHLSREWAPNSSCDDNLRQTRSYFLKAGEQSDLAFDGAAVNIGRDGLFSSVVIILKSSRRIVNVKVWKDDRVETVLDKPV